MKTEVTISNVLSYDTVMYKNRLGRIKSTMSFIQYKNDEDYPAVALEARDIIALRKVERYKEGDIIWDGMKYDCIVKLTEHGYSVGSDYSTYMNHGSMYRICATTNGDHISANVSRIPPEYVTYYTQVMDVCKVMDVKAIMITENDSCDIIPVFPMGDKRIILNNIYESIIAGTFKDDDGSLNYKPSMVD